jgi:hypothetical protein
MVNNCIYCGAGLLRNPEHPHWSHCPSCEPALAEHVLELQRRERLFAFASFAANDKRGLHKQGPLS